MPMLPKRRAGLAAIARRHRSRPRGSSGQRAVPSAGRGSGGTIGPGRSAPPRNAQRRLPRIRRSVAARQPRRRRRVPAVAAAEDAHRQGGRGRPVALRAQPRLRRQPRPVEPRSGRQRQRRAPSRPRARRNGSAVKRRTRGHLPYAGRPDRGAGPLDDLGRHRDGRSADVRARRPAAGRAPPSQVPDHREFRRTAALGAHRAPRRGAGALLRVAALPLDHHRDDPDGAQAQRASWTGPTRPGVAGALPPVSLPADARPAPPALADDRHSAAPSTVLLADGHHPAARGHCLVVVAGGGSGGRAHA